MGRDSVSRLGLGTAQLGMDYGVANRSGRPDRSIVRSILSLAEDQGMGYLDTAPGYGASESLIGELRPATWTVRTITKTNVFQRDQLTAEDGRELLASVERSLASLKSDAVYGLLVHHGMNLLKPGANHLIDALREAKARGWVCKIGYSAYSSQEVERINDKFIPDIVQLPFNVLDQRILASGLLDVLQAAGVEIHTRSVFLQGLLLMDVDRLHPYFVGIQPVLRAYHHWLNEHDLTALQGNLAFALAQPSVAAVIVGGETAEQVQEIVTSVRSLDVQALDFSDWAIDDEPIINPSFWPARDDLVRHNASKQAAS